jgi:hypothetical protein
MRWPDHNQLLKRVPCLTSAGNAFLVGCRKAGVQVCSWATGGKSTPQVKAEAWNRRLKDEKEALLSLVHGMEAEFLTTGDGLMRLSQQLGEIQKECQSLTELTLGQTQDAAVQFAFQLLKKAEDLVLASYEQYDHVFATFSDLQQRLAQVSKQRDELMRVLLPLSFITMSFRIEASRHPVEVQQAFFTLTGDINRTVSDVRATMERQFNDLAASERIAHRLMEQISGSIRQHRKEVTATLAASRNQLRALSAALISSGAGATDLSKRNQAVTRHISGIVMAQQCQDITRQRIEHVGEALDEMREHVDGGRAATPATDADARQFILRAGQIQLQQVQNVFEQLNHAAESLQSGVQGLRTEAGTAAELVVKVGGTALDAKVARQCQQDIGDILGIVKKAVQKITGIIAAFEPLQASFVDCTSKATALADDVRHAGLNAQVFAIRTLGGATLEVLAGRVYAISEEVIQQVERMGAALNYTSEMVNNVRQRLEDFAILCQAEQVILADESVLSQKKLAELDRAIPVQIRGVTQRQGAFALSVEEVLANIKFPATVATASSRSIGFFQDLVTWGCEGGSGLAVESAASQKIDQLKSKYTMESERDAHAAALHLAVDSPKTADPQPAIEIFDNPELPSGVTRLAESEITPPATHPPTGKPVAGGLGDNVELF